MMPSPFLENTSQKKKSKYQLVRLHDNRVNATKIYFQKFKNHFISYLSATAINFTIALWYMLLLQAQDTSIMIRK